MRGLCGCTVLVPLLSAIVDRICGKALYRGNLNPRMHSILNRLRGKRRY
jgi:hypothetical protein